VEADEVEADEVEAVEGGRLDLRESGRASLCFREGRD
jgi:hypothetical protein